MGKLKLYLETSVWNFHFADDAPEKMGKATKPQTEKSLAEVRLWRAAAQEELGRFNPKEEAEKLNSRAKAIIHKYGLKVKGISLTNIA